MDAKDNYLYLLNEKIEKNVEEDKLPRLLFMRANYYYKTLKRFEEASDDAQRALNHSNNADEDFTTKIHWFLSEVYFQQKKYKEAMEQFDDQNMLSHEVGAQQFILARRICMAMKYFRLALTLFGKAQKSTTGDQIGIVNSLIEDCEAAHEASAEQLIRQCSNLELDKKDGNMKKKKKTNKKKLEGPTPPDERSDIKQIEGANLICTERNEEAVSGSQFTINDTTTEIAEV